MPFDQIISKIMGSGGGKGAGGGGGDSQSEKGTQATAAAAEASKPETMSLPPTKSIVISKPTGGANGGGNASKIPPPPDTLHRAIHKIRLRALSHNFTEVESAANRQRCSVFVVVKADGYGHGAIATALYLADNCGADAFAVATLEEGIALRKAFQQTQPGGAIVGQPLASAATSVTTTATKTVATSVTTASTTHVSSLFHSTSDDALSNSSSNASSNLPPLPVAAGAGAGAGALIQNNNVKRRSLRPTQIRIMVLGPPVGFPRCFDDYYHHNIEVMISGPEVAKSLLEWVVNTDERKRKSVEQHATELKEMVLNEVDLIPRPGVRRVKALDQATTAEPTEEQHKTNLLEHRDSNLSTAENSMDSKNNSNPAMEPNYHPPSATLGNVTGSDLAKEVREILRNQKVAAQQQQLLQHQQRNMASTNEQATAATTTAPPVGAAGAPFVPSMIELSNNNGAGVAKQQQPSNALNQTTAVANNPPAPKIFGGIEEAARMSRTVQKAIKNEVFMESGDDDDENSDNNNVAAKGTVKNTQNCSEHNQCTEGSKAKNHPTKNSASPKTATIMIKPQKQRQSVVPPRKRLRWHALVDSGMGRLGFRTDPVSHVDIGKRRDSVEIIKELVDLEHTSPGLECPIEFNGMMTHMADANPTSDYTQSQINKFRNLLQRVRNAGILVPTISTDNSAALLTPTLDHFDPKQLLTQENVDTRGFVRTGGAIYGQRPSFKQLRAVSTLMASVRHVAILKRGESVGYDRAYIAPMNVRIATLTIGFADGYPRELGNGVGKVSIRGHLFPVAGNVCMDMVMVELGPVKVGGGQQHHAQQQLDGDNDNGIDDYQIHDDDDDPGANVVVGDSAILWGPDDDDEDGEGLVKLQDIAAKLKTTQSALTCGLDKERVRREYTP